MFNAYETTELFTCREKLKQILCDHHMQIEDTVENVSAVCLSSHSHKNKNKVRHGKTLFVQRNMG